MSENCKKTNDFSFLSLNQRVACIQQHYSCAVKMNLLSIFSEHYWLFITCTLPTWMVSFCPPYASEYKPKRRTTHDAILMDPLRPLPCSTCHSTNDHFKQSSPDFTKIYYRSGWCFQQGSCKTLLRTKWHSDFTIIFDSGLCLKLHICYHQWDSEVSLNLHFLLSRKAYSHVRQLSSVLLWQRPVLLLYLPWLTLDSQASFSPLSFHCLLHSLEGSAGNPESGKRQNHAVHKSRQPGDLGD
jgi:hypothetical protein